MEEIILLLQGNSLAGFVIAFCVFCLIAALLLSGICFVYLVEIKAINKKYIHACHKQNPLGKAVQDNSVMKHDSESDKEYIKRIKKNHGIGDEALVLGLIETAPKNGTPILLFYFNLNRNDPVLGLYDDLNNEWCNDVGSPLINPTHWTPLKHRGNWHV